MIAASKRREKPPRKPTRSTVHDTSPPFSQSRAIQESTSEVVVEAAAPAGGKVASSLPGKGEPFLYLTSRVSRERAEGGLDRPSSNTGRVIASAVSAVKVRAVEYADHQ